MNSFKISDQLAKDIIRLRGRVHAYETYDPATTALVVVDMQNYFLDENEQAYCSAARHIVPAINRLAEVVRQTGGKVIWVKTQAKPEIRHEWDNFLELYTEETKAQRFKSLVPGAHGFEIWPKLAVATQDEIVIKTRYSAFIQGSSNIEEILRELNIVNVLVAGTVTNVCCDSTARDAMMRGFRTIMVSDGNAAFDTIDHEVALNTFIRVFGDVRSTDEIIELLQVGSAPRETIQQSI
jgi:ureidoacrylate peracid hydrolase